MISLAESCVICGITCPLTERKLILTNHFDTLFQKTYFIMKLISRINGNIYTSIIICQKLTKISGLQVKCNENWFSIFW